MDEHKSDNAHFAAKLDLRRHFLRKYPGKFEVLDCCQGSGALWSALRKEFKVASYMGVDLKPKKGRLKIDSVDLCKQAGLRQNVIDVDTYGSPWKHYEGICEFATQPTTIFLTFGLIKTPRCSVSARVLGLDKLTPAPPPTCFRFLVAWTLPFLLGMALARHRVIESVEMVPATTSTARYFGIRIEPKPVKGPKL